MRVSWSPKLLLRSALVITFVIASGCKDDSPPPDIGNQNGQPSGPPSFSVNPDTLRDRMMTGDLNVLSAWQQVEQAKTHVDQARAALLPSLNLGAVLSSGSFALAGIQILLPMLMPSHWFDLRESDYLLKAQGEAFNASLLNMYASAESAYLTVVADQKTRAALASQEQDLTQLVGVLSEQVKLGLASTSDLNQAQAQLDQLTSQVVQIDAMINKEIEALRQMLGLPLTTVITLEDTEVPPSPVEGQTAEQVLDQALQLAPEAVQIQDLVVAAKAAKWSAAFSWLNGVTLSSGAGSSTFGNVSATGSVNLGFGIFPAIQLASQNIDSINLQNEQMKLTMAQTVETALNAVDSAKKQLAADTDAVTSQTNYYASVNEQFKLGMTTLNLVLQAHNQLTNFLTAQAQAVTQLNTSRVALHRIFMGDRMATLPKCQIDATIKLHNSQGNSNDNSDDGSDSGSPANNAGIGSDQMSMEKACGLTSAKQ